MRVFTFVNGSSAMRIAKVERAVLPRRWPTSPRSVATLSCLSLVERPVCARPLRKLLCFPFAATPCRKDTAFSPRALLDGPLRSRAAGTAAGLAAEGRARTWSKARLLTFSSAEETSSFRIFSAPVIAASSSDRSCARWSQSLALTSHRSVRSFRYVWSSFSRPSSFSRSFLVVAISPFSCSMSPSSPSMAPLFSSSFPDRLLLVSSQVFFVFSHSPSTSVFCVSKSSLSFVRVSMMPWEWYLYSGSDGSTPACSWRNALTSRRAGAATRSSASARAKALSTDCRRARKEAGFVPSSAWMAFSRVPMALDRSAAVASYSASSFAHCASVAFSSAAVSSCLALRSLSSDDFSASEAVFSSISDDRRSISSRPLVMDSDFVAVELLQKQANLSYDSASFAPSSSTSVFMPSRRSMTFSMGVCATAPRRAAAAASKASMPGKCGAILGPSTAAMLGWKVKSGAPAEP
mmetsp:Transcript_1107/g.3364  ORF Transcript_1107/g.3364 Transcript_1107/m.3364 type:complete len:464 (+) Transcript_1107:937-2328(+)